MPPRLSRFVAVAVLVLFGLTDSQAQEVPDLSGEWTWKSRQIARPLHIQQTRDELIIDAIGLPQGAVQERFWLDGRVRDETYPGPGYVRRYLTNGRWDGRVWVATVKAYAGWTGGRIPAEPHTVVTRWFTLDSSGARLTVTSRGAGGAPAGQSAGDFVYEFERVR